VLVGEVVSLLAPRPDGVYVDATLGLGGHTARAHRRRRRPCDWDRSRRDALAMRATSCRISPRS
jgi:16S rRNA C1402 N4-methylase RsmH